MQPQIFFLLFIVSDFTQFVNLLLFRIEIKPDPHKKRPERGTPLRTLRSTLVLPWYSYFIINAAEQSSTDATELCYAKLNNV